MSSHTGNPVPFLHIHKNVKMNDMRGVKDMISIKGMKVKKATIY